MHMPKVPKSHVPTYLPSVNGFGIVVDNKISSDLYFSFQLLSNVPQRISSSKSSKYNAARNSIELKGTEFYSQLIRILFNNKNDNKFDIFFLCFLILTLVCGVVAF